MRFTYRSVIPNLIGNRNALVEFAACIKIPACVEKTIVLCNPSLVSELKDL
jgi:hypothetical protein